MNVFVLVNWVLVIVTSIILFAVVRVDRSLLLKPNIMVILFFHVMCQRGTAIQASQIESFLPMDFRSAFTGLSNQSHYLISGVLLILAFPTILTILREGKVVTAKSFFDYLRVSLFSQ